MKLALGENVTVVQSTDPSTRGLRGKFVGESMKTIRIQAVGRSVVIPKKGTAIAIGGTNEVLLCDEMYGRLEERLARGSAR